MPSPFAPSSSFRNVAASPDTTSTTGCALSRNYKARVGNSNLGARTEPGRSVRRLSSMFLAHAKGTFMTRVAINGLGRIGRATLKILMDTEGLELVAANDIGEADDIAYLLKYDTVYGRYNKTVEVTSDAGLLIGGRRLTLLCEQRPGTPAVAIVERGHRIRVHGQVHNPRDLDAHIRAGARYVILSAPSNDDDVDTIVTE